MDLVALVLLKALGGDLVEAGVEDGGDLVEAGVEDGGDLVEAEEDLVLVEEWLGEEAGVGSKIN